MYSVETASDVYDELMSRLNTKGSRTLNNLRMACDLIVAARGIMNFSRVAEMATKQYGGPRKQSVQNNPELKRYIAARMAEYNQSRPTCSRKDSQPGKVLDSWPEEGLSVRTKACIMQLRTRLEMVEKRYSELRLQQEKITKANPVNLSKAIEIGNINNEFVIPYEITDTAASLREAIIALLKVGEYISSLQTETHDSRTGLILRRPSGDIVILTPSQFDIVNNFIKHKN
ncbi:hypothetical protein HWQ18_07000 [Enterobacter ludwigii]|uniref:hypothetical protein n=1 Tax=Enterobacter ludwigii TaxID=299767 RepID=UPI00159C105A|nr:hypothetical protein [Enterobacter ludwigii]QLA06269.1 hypothetical protein HWQ18_07000 [Enterobacter ludwigii]